MDMTRIGAQRAAAIERSGGSDSESQRVAGDCGGAGAAALGGI